LLLPERSEDSPESFERDSPASADFSATTFSAFGSLASALTAFARGVFFGASVFSAEADTSATTRRDFLTGVVSWISSMFIDFSFLGDICDCFI
jgi:hypothetical protein